MTLHSDLERNGVLVRKGETMEWSILVKPKYANEKGEASIQTGYGLEGVFA